MELIRKDQPLAELHPAPEGDQPPRQAELVTGKFTTLSEDKKTLFADIDGYAQLSQKSTKEFELSMVTILPLVSVAEDGMEVTVTLYPPPDDVPFLTAQQLYEILDDNGVHFGMTTEYLSEILTRCKEDSVVLTDEVVARSIPPLNGNNSSLHFEMEVGPLPGTIMENGKIDFRERKMFVGVVKGQIIATQIPPTEGTAGQNVLGKAIPQIPGKLIPVKVSDDAEFDEESGVVRATRSGILSMVSDNSIKVCAKQVIPGNIDFSTGNIESKDAVEIEGAILPGFKVKTHGDLLLGGNVRSATLKCKGNLVIKGGILGKRCRVNSKGDADIGFIEQGRLRAKGKVVLHKQAYFSRIMADGDILCAEKSQVMGGFILSGASLSLGNVGSPNSPPSLLAAGIAPGRYLRYLKIREQFKELEAERLSFLMRHGIKKKVKERKALEEAVFTLHQEMMRMNLIPGADNVAESGAAYVDFVTIHVHGTIFRGTELQIGNTTTTLENDLKSVSFSLTSDHSTFKETDL
jgi:uncharacterized protein (DUF342 family)